MPFVWRWKGKQKKNVESYKMYLFIVFSVHNMNCDSWAGYSQANIFAFKYFIMGVEGNPVTLGGVRVLAELPLFCSIVVPVSLLNH